jgi:hypothetical protein
MTLKKLTLICSSKIEQATQTGTRTTFQFKVENGFAGNLSFIEDDSEKAKAINVNDFIDVTIEAAEKQAAQPEATTQTTETQPEETAPGETL